MEHTAQHTQYGIYKYLRQVEFYKVLIEVDETRKLNFSNFVFKM